jgi:hypothetical protein
MNIKNNTDVKNNNLKLTNEEIKCVDGFADLSAQETEEQTNLFIYADIIANYIVNEILKNNEE